jgi:hypothetical protein
MIAWTPGVVNSYSENVARSARCRVARTRLVEQFAQSLPAVTMPTRPTATARVTDATPTPPTVTITDADTDDCQPSPMPTPPAVTDAETASRHRC